MGERRIGVAVSDPAGILAVPLEAIEVRSEDEAVDRVVALAREHAVERVVVGLPLSLDGSLGPQAQRVKSFARALEERVGLPVVTWDERLSTVAAAHALADAGVRRRKRKKRLDSTAASLILQGYLDRGTGGR